mmetsp:Transcript_22658/g.33124  ORF Transcript_22658/g.33124 Transcript_22658/m.33124 type:complete len:387 (+) Transcript_22658:39-1199(+)
MTISSLLDVAVGGSSLCFLYSLVLNTVRHHTYEDLSWTDTLQDIALNGSILAVALITQRECDEGSFCKALSCSIIAISVAMIIRNYKRAVSGVKFKEIDLSGKVFIVTGSSAGLGLETAREIARMGGTVILGCRSKDKALNARANIVSSAGCSETKVIFLPLDLCSFKSVRDFVKEFKALGLPLHCLINNAGVMMPTRTTTKDGLEMVFTSNHLGHFLLTNLLLPDLEATKGRVVNVASSMHRAVKTGIDFDDIMSERNYSLFGTYSRSKLANVLFSLELDRRLRSSGSNVTVNAVHPGIVLTEVTRSLNFFVRQAHALLTPLMLLVQKLPSQGAYTSVFAATSPALEGVSGRYLVHCKSYPVSKHASDPDAASKLWDVSSKLTGL